MKKFFYIQIQYLQYYNFSFMKVVVILKCMIQYFAWMFNISLYYPFLDIVTGQKGFDTLLNIKIPF